MKLCDYGCGQKAKYQFKNGKWCCSSNVMKCPETIKKWKQVYNPDKIKVFKKTNCQYCNIKLHVFNLKRHEKSCYLNPINLRLCPSCEKPIKNKDNKFCSIECIPHHVRHHSTKTKQKISDSIRLAYKQGKMKNKRPYINREKRKEYNKNLKDIWEIKFEKLTWDVLPLSQKRKRVLKEQKYKCLLCGIKEWNRKDITLHFDHINGDKTNNERENVRYLCPNCHSQTPTYCGNKQKLPQYEHLKTTKERLSTIA